MKMVDDTKFQIILTALQEFGLLLESDKNLPSVTRLVAGEVVSGSWWQHPKSQQIFCTLQELDDHADVLITKLISGKVTFVHRDLWPAVLAVARAREPWQVNGLSPGGKTLLEMIDQKRSLLTNALEWPSSLKSQKPGDVVRELEKRLLIYTEEFHTQTGAHAKKLQSWDEWRRHSGLTGRAMRLNEAKRKIESRVAAMNKRFASKATVPWSARGDAKE